MKKTHNERGAGRKPKYNCKTKKISVPICIIDEVEKLASEYLTKKN